MDPYSEDKISDNRIRFDENEQKENDEYKKLESGKGSDGSETDRDNEADSEPVNTHALKPENRPDQEKLDNDGKKSMEDASKEHSLCYKKSFSLLYEKALAIIQKEIVVKDTEVERAYVEIKNSFKQFEFTNIDFKISEYLIAYFKNYAQFNSSLAHNRFLDALKNCPTLQERMNKENLKIISLGGGPGTDLLGFCSALQDFKNSSIKKLNITVVDKWKRWGSFFNLIEFLVQEGDYGQVSTFFKNKDIISSFMTVDLLSEEQPQEYIRNLQESDIVLLVRVLDCFKFKDASPKDLLSKIVSQMKSEALLLLVDSVTIDYSKPEVNKVYKSVLDKEESESKAIITILMKNSPTQN